MNGEQKIRHETWSSERMFLLAAVGGAVGIGNIWRFPYLTGEYGGGAFVLVYLACIAGIMLPMLVGELLVGRRGRMSAVLTLANVARAEGASPLWGWLGVIFMVAAFLGMAFYSVVTGWILDYTVKAASGAFSGLDPAASGALYEGMLADTGNLVFWHAMVMAITIFVVMQGVRGGIERAVRWLMPGLFLLLLVMVGYAAVAGDMAAAVDFMFTPDFSTIDGNVFLVALGQAFFSIGVGTGPMITYAAYLPQGVSIPRAATIIVAADTVVALLAGLAVFPIVLALNLPPDQGSGLVFKTLPVAFGGMPGTSFFATLFFVLLSFAALTSTIGLLEIVVCRLQEKRGFTRKSAAVAAGGAMWIMGLAAVFSFNIWSEVRPLAAIPYFTDRPYFADRTIFELFEYVAANVIFPLGGLLMAVFAGWVVSARTAQEEMGVSQSRLFTLWRFFLRYVAPLAIAIMLISGFV